MIAYLEGKLISKSTDRIILLAGQVGYEVLVPGFVMDTLAAKDIGDSLSLYIYHQQSERQPKPVLIGFNNEEERAFFEAFITVEAIGALKAVKALRISVEEVAAAIESGNLGTLKRLNGIGERTAHKIIATLKGKMGRFAGIGKTAAYQGAETAQAPDFIDTVLDVLVNQLGHKVADARKMIDAAMKRKPLLSTPEDLFDEIYKGASRDER